MYREPIFSTRRTNGCSFLYSSGRMRGALTALRGRSPRRMERTCSHTSMLTFSCASTVEAPRCGVATTLGWLISFVAAESCSGGSVLQTSMPAPAMCPFSSASSRAASSIMPPRATFRIRAPFLMLCNSLVLIIPLVLAIRGV